MLRPFVVRTRPLCLATLLFAAFFARDAFGQGCVAVRHVTSCSAQSSSAYLPAHQFQGFTSFRWFRSDRHFRGRHEEKHRKAEGSEVINNTASLDAGITYAITSRLSTTLVVPVIYNDRSSLYEHDRRSRYHTQSYGLGDARLTFNYWLLDPAKGQNGNLSVGLGVKAPTGNYNYKDGFHTIEGVQQRPVDQSIQLGDGAWAPSVEIQGFAKLFRNASGYLNAFYLFNLRNTNGTRTESFRRDSMEVGAITSVMSSPDQYLARAGMNYAFLPAGGWSASLGARIEGIPARDVLGKEDGFRRPGYIVSAEPGITYMPGKTTFSLYVPVALVRDRIRSVYDIKTGRHGDAAFADFAVFFTVAARL